MILIIDKPLDVASLDELRRKLLRCEMGDHSDQEYYGNVLHHLLQRALKVHEPCELVVESVGGTQRFNIK